MHIFVLRGLVYPIVMKLGKQLYIRMLAHLTGFLTLKFWSRDSLTAKNNSNLQSKTRGTERHLSQLFFNVLCCFTSARCYTMPSFNHVHMLTETVNTEKQVT